LFSFFRLLLLAVACGLLGDDQFRFNAGHGLVQFFSSLLYMGRPGLHASLVRKEDVHRAMFTSLPWRGLWAGHGVGYLG
jgi:hypothetical protein